MDDTKDTPDSRFATSMTIGQQLCEALGVDAGKTVSLQLIVESPKVVKLVVTRLVTEAQGLAVARLLTQRFDLVERGEAVMDPVLPTAGESYGGSAA